MGMESHVIAHYSHANFHLVNEYLHFDGLPTTAHYSHASFHLVDEYLHFDGLLVTRESIIKCGLSLDTNGRWQTKHFSFIFARHHDELMSLKQILLQCFAALVVEGSISSIVLQYTIT